MEENMIYSMLDDKIEDIFIEMQKAFDITSGDISPEDQYDLMQKESEISALIANVLRKQMN